MAEPSSILANIVGSLQTLIGNTIQVKAHDGNFEGKEQYSSRHATILVACTSLGLDPESQDYEPPTAIAQFTAFIISKQPAHPKTRGSVAMDIAALIAGHVRRSFLDIDGVVRRSENIRVINLHTRETLQDGLSIWSVNWSNLVSLTPANNNGVLNYLDEIRNTISLSDDPDVPTVGWEVDFMADREDGAPVP